MTGNIPIPAIPPKTCVYFSYVGRVNWGGLILITNLTIFHQIPVVLIDVLLQCRVGEGISVMVIFAGIGGFVWVFAKVEWFIYLVKRVL